MSEGHGQAGFTIVELLVAVLVIGFVALAAGAVLASGTRHASAPETRQNLSHRAQQEVERLTSLDYATLAHAVAPATSSADPDSPLSWYSTSTGKYRWNRVAAGSTTAETLVVDAGGVVEAERAWSDGTASGHLFAFVTWVTDGRCGSGCPTSQNYKRVTVAATADSGAEAAKPVFVSTIVADPHALPAGRIVNGNANPLTDPSITCHDTDGNTVQCTASVGATNVNEWYLSDTPATAAYSAPSASHPTHPTVAPSGTCTPDTTTGCPVPDLLSTEQPPSPPEGAEPPPLLDYSSELGTATGGYAGGRAISRDVACSLTPTATENAKGAMWVTGPLTQATTLTGSGGMTLNSHALHGASASVTLCVAIYATGTSISNLVAVPPTRLGVVAYTVAEWPTTSTPLSFSFDFLSTGSIMVNAGQRIGVRVWLAADSGTDVALLYDHPSYTSVLQLNSR